MDASDAPWGRRRPGLLFRSLLGASRAVPQLPVLKQLAFVLRRLARSSVEDPVDVEHWGFRLRLRTRGNISEATFLFMPRRWDAAERAYLASTLQPDATFVDVGANAGGYVWWVLHVLGSSCRIVAVEPSPDLAARLRFNLETNGVRNVEVVEAAVGTEAGQGSLHVDERNLGQSRLQAGPAEYGLRVAVVDLATLVRRAGLDRLDVLKIDVEGMEAAILRDFFARAAESLWPRILLTEMPDSPEHRDLAGTLERIGYRAELRTRLNVAFRRSRADAAPQAAPP